MLLRQDFRRRHQGRLHPVSRRPVGGNRRHHGFSGAHIPLEQPVHGHAPAQVPGNLLHSPPLGPGQGKWQPGAERLQLQIFISSHLLHRPPGPHQAEACGKYKKLLKNQPPSGPVQLLGILGLMDGPVGLVCRKNPILGPDLLGKNLRRRPAALQGLEHCLGNRFVCQPRRKRIHRQNPPGHKGLLPRRLKNRIGHIVTNEIPRNRSVKYILFPVFQPLCRVLLVEKGDVQPGGVVRHRDLGEFQSLPDEAGPGAGHNHSPKAGGLAHLQAGNGHQLGAVLIGPGIVI
ncbi:unknown [Firmicutes bacterium CAG:137]|nr:unknown [Firmicutes bacterium CAG:137]